MGFLHQFDNFDPLTAVIPKSLPLYGLDVIAERARSLLSSRTKEQIVAAAQFIDWSTGQFFEECETSDGIDIRAWAKDYFWGFKQCYQSYQFEEAPEFPKGRPYEYFAVMSLWFLSDCLSQVARPNKRVMTPIMGKMIADMKLMSPEKMDLIIKMEEPYFDEAAGAVDKLSRASYTLSNSLEAVCFAEHLYELDQLELRHQLDIRKEIKQEATQKARRAANMRHASTTHLIKRFAVDLYLKEREMFKSVKEAARTIVDDVVNFSKEQKASTLSGVSAFEQVYTWLLQAEKDFIK